MPEKVYFSVGQVDRLNPVDFHDKYRLHLFDFKSIHELFDMFDREDPEQGLGGNPANLIVADTSGNIGY